MWEPHTGIELKMMHLEDQSAADFAFNLSTVKLRGRSVDTQTPFWQTPHCPSSFGFKGIGMTDASLFFVPDPKPVPEPVLEPVPESAPESALVPEPVLEPETVPEFLSASEPALEPKALPEPEPASEPALVPGPVPEPVHHYLCLSRSYPTLRLWQPNGSRDEVGEVLKILRGEVPSPAQE